MAVVYSIGKRGSIIDQRYVGVSKDHLRREKEHFKLLNEGLHPTEPLQKSFDESFDFRIELYGELEYCYEMEKKLRPKSNMGLNIAPGGKGGWKIEYQNNPFSKHNRNGLMGNEFTSETSKEFALERSKERKLPAQIAKDTGEFGNFFFWTEEHRRQVSESNVKKFTGTTTVTDKNGKTKRMKTEDFRSQQKGKREDWQYVGSASKEAKKRRGEI